jgi:hypothetical protein
VRHSAGMRQSLRCVGDCRGLVEIQLHPGRKRVPLQRSDSSALPTDPRPTRVSCSFFLVLLRKSLRLWIAPALPGTLLASVDHWSLNPRTMRSDRGHTWPHRAQRSPLLGYQKSSCPQALFAASMQRARARRSRAKDARTIISNPLSAICCNLLFKLFREGLRIESPSSWCKSSRAPRRWSPPSWAAAKFPDSGPGGSVPIG